MKKHFITADEIKDILGVGRSKAYKILRSLNKELNDMGYITVAGKCPVEFFEKKYYGSVE